MWLEKAIIRVQVDWKKKWPDLTFLEQKIRCKWLQRLKWWKNFVSSLTLIETILTLLVSMLNTTEVDGSSNIAETLFIWLLSTTFVFCFVFFYMNWALCQDDLIIITHVFREQTTRRAQLYLRAADIKY